MGKAGCVIRGCKPDSGGSRFRFPNPSKNPLLFAQWKRILSSLLIWTMRTDIEVFHTCYICDRHFAAEDIVMTGSRKKLVRQGAPSLFLQPTSSVQNPQSEICDNQGNDSKELSDLETSKQTTQPALSPKIIQNTSSAGCRVCLKSENTGSARLFPITNYSWTTNETFKDKLQFCVPSLTLTDENKICECCVLQLKATWEFINKCLHAESVFSNTDSSCKNVEIVCKDSPIFNSNTVDITKSDDDCDDSQQYLLEDSSSNHNEESNAKKARKKGSKIPLDSGQLDKFRFISATVDEMSSQQSEDLLKMGIKTIDMSHKSTGKKRIIYLARDYMPADYDCPLCDAKLTSSCDITDHTRLHHQKRIVSADGPSFPCDCCDQKFSEEEALQVHRLFAHNIKYNLSCARCKKKFKTLGNLVRHKRMFKGLNKCAIKCPNQCAKEFFSKTALEAHLKDVADAPCCNYVLCNVCSVKFTKEDFKAHSKVHPSYLCSQCGKSFAASTSLTMHTKLVHKSSATMCHECGKILKTQIGLRNHLRNGHNTDRDAPTFICDQCPMTYKSRQRLRHHHMMRHTSQPPKVKCTICQKLFFTNWHLRSHIRLIHEPPKKFECKLCGCKFSRKDYFDRHLNNHDVYSQFTCSICKICFASENRLKAHEKLGHDENGKALDYGQGGRGNAIKGPKPFQRSSINQKLYNIPFICKICHKVVSSNQNLLQHYKTHLRIREKKCEKCGLVMANSNNFNRHMKLHEDPNFDKRCRICYITKSSKVELLEHMQTVHKHLKHECKYCGKRFGRKYLLYSHENLEHQEATERKKEALDIIYKKPVFVPDGLVVLPKSRKGVKRPDYHSTDVDELITKISQGEATIQDSSDVCLDNFNIVNEEYELQEQERVCTELVEEVVYLEQQED